MFSSEFAKIIFATLLTILPIEKNNSYVPISVCDSKCQKTPICIDSKCEIPKYNIAIYLENLNKLRIENPKKSLKKISKKAKLKSYLRKESKSEKLIRYVVLSEAISSVSSEYSKKECLYNCINDECRKNCNKSAFWSEGNQSLAGMLIAMSVSESKLKASVHGGYPNGWGDCVWYDQKGKRTKPMSRGAYPDPNSCRSFCLGQINIGRKGKVKKFNWGMDDLIGVDYISTRRCLTVMAWMINRSKNYCLSNGKANHGWAAAAFSLYGTGSSCNHEHLNKRSGIFYWVYGLLGKEPKFNVYDLIDQDIESTSMFLINTKHNISFVEEVDLLRLLKLEKNI